MEVTRKQLPSGADGEFRARQLRARDTLRGGGAPIAVSGHTAAPPATCSAAASTAPTSTPTSRSGS
jgi:hypothetical protein